jgi:hypothetical protein
VAVFVVAWCIGAGLALAGSEGVQDAPLVDPLAFPTLLGPEQLAPPPIVALDPARIDAFRARMLVREGPRPAGVHFKVREGKKSLAPLGFTRRTTDDSGRARITKKVAGHVAIGAVLLGTGAAMAFFLPGDPIPADEPSADHLRQDRTVAELSGLGLAVVSTAAFLSVPVWKGQIGLHYTVEETDWWIERHNRLLAEELALTPAEVEAAKAPSP